tara:strand:+ start:108 stop:887 length:780 start_codon:yes stop_codon:yes gene_type:complete
MGKIFYVILISFVCLKINSCAEIDTSSESANSTLIGKVLSPAYDILMGPAKGSSDNLFVTQKTTNKKGVTNIPKNNNIFLVKHNSSGIREWIMDLGMSDEETEVSLTFDSSYNLYMTGYTRNSLEGKNNYGYFTVFLFKYDSYGNREWIKKLGNSEVEYGARLIVDSSNNVYVTGFSSEFESENEFGPRKTLLAKYDTFGNRIWIKSLGSTLADFGWDVTVDSMDKIYVTRFSENSFAQKKRWQDDFILMEFNTDGIKL